MRRYPDAISFAPGAPHPDSNADLDLERYVGRFLDHLVTELGHTPSTARRLLYEYGPSRGLINDLLADLLRRDHGVDVPPQAVVVTVGAQEAMLLALRALIRSDDDLLAVADPCYVGITGAARLLGVEMVPIPETEDGPHLEALRAVCRAARRTGRRVRVCSVTPDFSHPDETSRCCWSAWMRGRSPRAWNGSVPSCAGSYDDECGLHSLGAIRRRAAPASPPLRAPPASSPRRHSAAAYRRAGRRRC